VLVVTGPMGVVCLGCDGDEDRCETDTDCGVFSRYDCVQDGVGNVCVVAGLRSRFDGRSCWHRWFSEESPWGQDARARCSFAPSAWQAVCEEHECWHCEPDGVACRDGRCEVLWSRPCM